MPATQSPFESPEEGAPISQEKRLGDRLVLGLEKIGGSLNNFSNIVIVLQYDYSTSSRKGR
jgi:hypothetical protein